MQVMARLFRTWAVLYYGDSVHLGVVHDWADSGQWDCAQQASWLSLWAWGLHRKGLFGVQLQAPHSAIASTVKLRYSLWNSCKLQYWAILTTKCQKMCSKYSSKWTIKNGNVNVQHLYKVIPLSVNDSLYKNLKTGYSLHWMHNFSHAV